MLARIGRSFIFHADSIYRMSILMHEEFEEARTKKALGMLILDRKNEFKELAEAVMHKDPTVNPIKDWEFFILNFCLDVSKEFKSWVGQSGVLKNSDMKALTILRQLGKGKTSMNQITRLLNTSYDLAEEFKVIYRRIE